MVTLSDNDGKQTAAATSFRMSTLLTLRTFLVKVKKHLVNSENKENFYQLLKRKPSVCSTSLHFSKLITDVDLFFPETPVLPRRIGSSSHNALRLNYIIVVFDYVTIHLLWISSRSCRKPRRHSAKESLFISIASISEHRKVFSEINFLVFK